MSTVTASEARTELPSLLDRVVEGEEITITRHGKPVATVIRPDSLRVRRASTAFDKAEHIRDLLDRGRDTPLSDLKGLSPEYAEELVAHIRAERDGI